MKTVENMKYILVVDGVEVAYFDCTWEATRWANENLTIDQLSKSSIELM